MFGGEKDVGLEKVSTVGGKNVIRVVRQDVLGGENCCKTCELVKSCCTHVAGVEKQGALGKIGCCCTW